MGYVHRAPLDANMLWIFHRNVSVAIKCILVHVAAAAGGHVKVMQQLVEMKADIDKTDGDGDTPLCVAAREGHAEVATLLLTAKAFIKLNIHSGFTQNRQIGSNAPNVLTATLKAHHILINIY